MDSRSMPVFHLHGDAYTRGQQHGVAFRRAIQASFDQWIQCKDRLTWQRARRLAARSWGSVESMAPGVAEEIRGIAEGCELAALDIYLLCGFEFFDSTVSGCTTAAYASGSGAVIGQNWDARPGTENNLVLLVHHCGNHEFVMVTSPGTLGWIGMNCSGLAFVTNDLILDRASIGLPSLVTRRLILQERSVSQALELLARLDHLSGRCYLLGDASGAVGAVEISPSIGPVALAGNPIVHTNHPIMPDVAMFEDIEKVAGIYPSSHERLCVARDYEICGAEDIRRLLASTKGAPDAICKSTSTREPTQTACSVIFDCKSRSASICLGRPDRGKYHTFSFSSMALA